MAVAFSTLWGAYREWLLLEAGCAPDSVNVYRRICYEFCNPTGGYLARLRRPKTWNHATATDLRAFLDRAATTGPRCGQPLSPRYQANAISAVKGLYAFAYETGLLGRDPMALVRAPRVGLDQPHSFEPAELAAILDAAQRDPDPRLYPMAWLAYGAALRSHAIAALRLEDFYPRPRPGRVRAARKGRPGHHWVPLHVEARAALDRYLAGRTLAAGDPLFGNRRFPHQPLRPGSVGRLLAGLIRDGAGLDHGSAHWFRHTGATRAVEAEEGQNIEHVRELLDHLDSRTTRRYIDGVKWRVREHAVDLIPDPRRPRKEVLRGPR